MVSKERYKFIVDHTTGMALDAVWLYLEDDSISYEDRKNKFIYVINAMAKDGLIVFAKNGAILDKNTISDKFMASFPECDKDLNNGVWFFTDPCPAGIGWVMSDGSIDWV